MTRAAERSRELRAERVQAGVCVKCAAPRQRPIRLCDACMARQVERTNEYKARHARKGLCTDCTRPAARGFRHCQKCRERIANSYETHRATLEPIHFVEEGTKALCGVSVMGGDRYSYRPHKVTCAPCLKGAPK